MIIEKEESLLDDELRSWEQGILSTGEVLCAVVKLIVESPNSATISSIVARLRQYPLIKEQAEHLLTSLKDVDPSKIVGVSSSGQQFRNEFTMEGRAAVREWFSQRS